MCSCQINSGSVIINSGVVLSVQESLDVLASTTLTFENNASLVQVNDAAINTGSITPSRAMLAPSSRLKEMSSSTVASP